MNSSIGTIHQSSIDTCKCDSTQMKLKYHPMLRKHKPLKLPIELQDTDQLNENDFIVIYSPGL